MIRITVCNLKGGVGKSTVSINLAYELAASGCRVLVVDLDKQANTTKFYNSLDYERPAVGELMLNRAAPVKVIRQKVSCPNGHIDLVPSNMNLLTANREILLDTLHAQHSRLNKVLHLVDDRYDYCLMDCPPDVDIGVINALSAAAFLILPADCGEWAGDGVRELLEQVQMIQEGHNPNLKVMGILRTMYRRTKACNAAVETLRGLNAPLMDTVLPRATVIQEATARHKAAAEYAPGSKGAAAMAALAQEVQARVKAVYGDGNE